MFSAQILWHLASIAVRSLGLVAIALAAIGIGRLRSPAARHAVWTLVVAGMLLSAVLEPVLPSLPLRVLRAAPAVAPAIPVVVIPAAVPSLVAAPALPAARAFRWEPLVLGIYAAGVLVFLLRLAYGYRFTHRVVRASLAIEWLAGEGIRQSNWVGVPLTVGWLRPAILLPAGWDAWESHKLAAVLAHERAHVRRGDWAIAVMAGVNRALFWFHPLAWWTERRLAALAEQACDDAALVELGSREEYARALLEIAAAVKSGGGRLVWEAMAMAKVAEVRMRIERILDESRQIPRGLTRPRWAALLVCGLPLLYFTTVLDLAPARAQEQPRPAAPASSSDMTREQLLLPEQFQTNLAQLQTLQAQLERANQVLSRDQEQKLETELQSAHTHLNYKLQELRDKIAEVRSGLANAQEVKTPNHPDVRRMEATLAVLEARYAEAAQRGVETQVELSQQLEHWQLEHRQLEQRYGELLREYEKATRNFQDLQSRAEATVTGPSLISRRDPEYTPEARRARIQGKVELAVTIGADGIAREMKVIRSLEPGLDRKAMECISQWRFRPASRNGEAITAFATVEVNFKL